MPWDRVSGQLFDALVDHLHGRRGRLRFILGTRRIPAFNPDKSTPTGPRVRGLREHGSIVGQNLMIRAGWQRSCGWKAADYGPIRGSTHGGKQVEVVR